MNISKLLLSASLSAIISLSSTTSVYAHDTDVYLKSSQSSSTTDILPKIMIILDSSGSMESNTIAVPGAYDPATTYTGGSWASDKVYWTSGSSAPTDSTTTQFFSKSNLKCDAALAAFADASGGHYDNDYIFMWDGDDSSGLFGKISSLQAADSTYDNYVECRNDQSDSAYTAGGSGSYKYFYNKADTDTGAWPGHAYTNSTANDATWNSFYKNFEKLYLWDGNYLNAMETGVAGVRTLTRMQVAQEAVSEILTTSSNIEVGLMSFNANNDGGEDGGSVIMGFNELNSTTRASMKTVVNSLSGYFNGTDNTNGQNYTPLSEAVYEAYRVFAGLAPDMGGRTSLDNPPNGYADPRPLSDYCAQDASTSSKCAPYSAATTRATVQGYFPTAGTTQPDYISPLANSCEKGYIILITDGDPYNDTDRNTQIDALVNGAKYSTTSVTGDTSSSSNRLDDLAGYLNNNDVNADVNGDQTIITFTVGFGTGISASGETLLKRTAGVGGGAYLTADNITELTDTLSAVIYSISATTASFAAPSLSVNAFNKLYNRDEIYFSLFQPQLYERWSGNIKKFTLCTAVQADANKCRYGELIDRNEAPAVDLTTQRIKDSAVSYWNSVTDGGEVELGGAGKVMYDDGYSSRKMYTYLGSYSGLSNTSMATPIVLSSTTTTAFYQAVETGSGGDPTILGLTAAATATEVGNLIDWIRGKDSYDADGDSSTTQRWVFGDPLHSSPLTVNYGAVETSPGVIDRDQPIIKLLVASNEGVIRLIDESTGAEQWSFIPKEMLASQSRLAKNAVGDHVYGVDATAVVHEIDVDNDGVVEPGDGDKIYAFVGMRRGSKDGTNDPVYNNIYAFDLTPSATLTAYTDLVTPKLMWVIEGGVGDYKLLGQTWSAPRVDTLTIKSGTTNADKLALFFAGGNSTNAESDSVTPTTGAAGNAVFIADALTGARLWWASDPAEVDGSGDGPDLALTDMDYPIPGDITLLDINLDYAVDRMYFGDLSGQVWRVDLDVDLNPAGSSPSARNGATAGHVLADLTCPRNVDGTRNCPATPIEQNWRRIYYRPNMGAVRDETYVTSGYIDYDMIFVGTGDRTDPLDALTATLPEHPVYNRLYAIRDYNFDFGPPASTPVPLVESNLYDITNGYINSTNPTEVALAKTGLTNSKGWMYSLKEASDPAWTALDLIGSRSWIGEKALARPVLFSGVVYFTTFTPANADTATQTCSPNEGLGRVYAFNALDGRIVVDMDGDGNEDQSLDLGGGIPSEVVTVIREDGTVAVVDDQTINVKNTNSVKDTFWIQE